MEAKCDEKYNSDSHIWNWPHSYCVVKCGAFWWRTFKQTQVPMPPVTSFLFSKTFHRLYLCFVHSELNEHLSKTLLDHPLTWVRLQESDLQQSEALPCQPTASSTVVNKAAAFQLCVHQSQPSISRRTTLCRPIGEADSETDQWERSMAGSRGCGYIHRTQPAGSL